MPTFVHLSDLHVSLDPDDTMLLSDTLSILDTVLARLEPIRPRLDFIIASGDLTNHGHPDAFDAIRDRFDAFGVPIIYALGNHDERAVFYERVLGQPERGTDPYDHDLVIAGLHVIVVDSSVPNSPLGALDDEQLAWLRGALERHPNVPKILVIHHPPAPTTHPVFEFLNLQPGTRERLAATIEGSKLLAILSGHVHHEQFMVWHGIPTIISAGLHNVTDVIDSDRFRAHSGGSYGLVTVGVNHDLNYQTVPLLSNPEPLHDVDLDTLKQYLTAAGH